MSNQTKNQNQEEPRIYLIDGNFRYSVARHIKKLNQKAKIKIFLEKCKEFLNSTLFYYLIFLSLSLLATSLFFGFFAQPKHQISACSSLSTICQ